MGWREELDAVRGEVHEFFSEAASYTPPGDDPEPLSVTVRVHDIVKTQGDLNGIGYAERVVDVPRIVFLASEVTPVKNAIVEFTDGRRYKVDVVDPQHGITITCDAVRMKAATP